MAAKINKCGFTIAEMLVALAVMGILLTAVAVAFNASAINYNENQDMFNALNSGRQAMMRMTSELRTATAVKLPTNEANTQCSFVTIANPTATPKNVRYCYEDQAVYYYPDWTNNPSDKHLLCGDPPEPPNKVIKVTSMTFIRTVVTPSLPDLPYVKSVQMSMTIAVGNNSQTITSAVVLRKVP